jgi:hypothetical protein
MSAPALAANLDNAFKVNDGSNKDAVDSAAGRAGYDTTQTDVYFVIGKVISVALSLLGVLFLGLILYGGFLWMSDQGNEDNVDKAKKIIKMATIGLIIVASSYAISYFIMNSLINTGGLNMTTDIY